MLSVQDLKLTVGGRDLITSATFQFQPGEKAAIVGVNGSGKTTLLRTLAGQTPPSGGKISSPRDMTVGYLPQHAELSGSGSLMETVREVFAEADRAIAELDELAIKMSELPHDGEEYARVAERFGDLQHEIDRLHAWEMDERIARVLDGLGFSRKDHEKRATDFSGGWRMRILLARVLLQNPDLLLLDEPTNHLDLETMLWLEDWIRSEESIVLFTSHERDFMNSLAERILEIHEGVLTIYRGNYDSYLTQREERWEQWRREYQNQQEKIAHLQKFIDRFRANASKATLVQSRVKELARIVPMPPPPTAAGTISFRFPDPDRGSREVFNVRGLRKSYGPKTVFNGADISVFRGEKVALVGLNGAGKTTLLRLLSGQQQADEGTIETGPKVRMAFFAQYDEEGLHPGNTVWQEMAGATPVGREQDARGLLGGFFFIGDDLDKPVNVLSGGERTRLRLAKMLFNQANVLLLDEPTNHLDIGSRMTLERALNSFDGTVIFVSHDRSFIDAVANRTVEIGEGGMRAWPGNYSDYCSAMVSQGRSSPLIQATRATAGGKSAGPSSAENAPAPVRDSAEGALAAVSAAKKAPHNREASKVLAREKGRLKKDIQDREQKIRDAEKRIADIQKQLTQPDIYSDPKKSKVLVLKQRELESDMESVMREWESLSEKLEEAG